ncbi:hypothetical protein C8Q79DRAFT_237703 [Trametes meyenii]|nr:hypothetical protein C8Q79DRAFT_237703 [Trametes meyenii]
MRFPQATAASSPTLRPTGYAHAGHWIPLPVPSPIHDTPVLLQANMPSSVPNADSDRPVTPSDPGQTYSPSKVASSPFDDPCTEIVLRTVDDVDFHVWRAILKEASTLFADMFGLPQPMPGPTTNSPRIIPITEQSVVIEPLLRLCYPVPDPEFTSLAELKPVLEAARKYQMDYIMGLLLRRLILFAENEPLPAYLIALQLRAAGVARAAAKLFLRHVDPCPFTEELRHVPAAAYYRLLEYRRKCVEVSCDAVLNTSWLGDEQTAFIWYKCPAGTCRPSHAKNPQLAGRYTVPSAWFTRHIQSVVSALSKTPCWEVPERPDVCDIVIMEGGVCANCRVTISSDVRRFSSTIAGEIERRISKIVLDVET